MRAPWSTKASTVVRYAATTDGRASGRHEVALADDPDARKARDDRDALGGAPGIGIVRVEGRAVVDDLLGEPHLASEHGDGIDAADGGHDATAADAAERRLETDDAAHGRRHSSRTGRVGARGRSRPAREPPRPPNPSSIHPGRASDRADCAACRTVSECRPGRWRTGPCWSCRPGSRRRSPAAARPDADAAGS